MGTEAIGNAGSQWGAAFRNKPLFLMSVKETRALFDGKLKKNMTLYEDTCTLGGNDAYRNKNTVYEASGNGSGGVFLDLGFLIKDETSSLKGNLSDKKDVDFYHFSIPYNRTMQNYFQVDICMDLPEGCDYNLTLYDEYGNQVGEAKWNGEGQKTVSIPNWDTATKKYCIKIENGNGEEVSPEDAYRIHFRISENKDQEKTDAVRIAYGELQMAYRGKAENWRECLDRYNAVLQETEKNYEKEVEKLHKEQYENLPEELKYRGDRTADELLQDLADGKSLSDAELAYVRIFSNLKDFSRAQQKAELKNDFSKEFMEELKDLGISQDDVEGMRIKIESDGTVLAEGIADDRVKTQVEQLVRKKYGEQMCHYYMETADSVGNLSSGLYRYAVNVQEVRRYLKGVTGEDVPLTDLYFTSDGKIGGLPEKASHLINDTKNNAKTERMRDALSDIIGYLKNSKAIGIPDFTAEFRLDNGVFDVVDNGFSIDMEALQKSMEQKNTGSLGVYEYQFKKVL